MGEATIAASNAESHGVKSDAHSRRATVGVESPHPGALCTPELDVVVVVEDDESGVDVAAVESNPYFLPK